MYRFFPVVAFRIFLFIADVLWFDYNACVVLCVSGRIYSGSWICGLLFSSNWKVFAITSSEISILASLPPWGTCVLDCVGLFHRPRKLCPCSRAAFLSVAVSSSSLIFSLRMSNYPLSPSSKFFNFRNCILHLWSFHLDLFNNIHFSNYNHMFL